MLLNPDSNTPWRDHLLLEVSNIRGVVTDQWKYVACRASEEILSAIEADRKAAEAEGRKRWVGWEGQRNPHRYFEREGVRYFSAGKFPHYYDPDQLYDLHADPFEQNNLAADPRFTEVLQDMQARLKQELAKLPHAFGEFSAGK